MFLAGNGAPVDTGKPNRRRRCQAGYSLCCAQGATIGLLLFGSAISHRVAAQIAPPKSVKDTAKKPVVSDQRVKIIKKTKPLVKVPGAAAGEVRSPPRPVDQDSLDRAIAAVRRRTVRS